MDTLAAEQPVGACLLFGDEYIDYFATINIFGSSKTSVDHLRNVHLCPIDEVQAYVPVKPRLTKFSKCLIDDCSKSDHLWTTPAYLRRHLVHWHKMNQNEAERLVPLNGNAKEVRDENEE